MRWNPSGRTWGQEAADELVGVSGLVVAAADRVVDRLVDLAAAVLEPRRLGRQVIGEIILADIFELAEALLDLLALCGKCGRKFGSS
jgi:hypothetical protein